jgi:hypothetical protein
LSSPEPGRFSNPAAGAGSSRAVDLRWRSAPLRRRHSGPNTRAPPPPRDGIKASSDQVNVERDHFESRRRPMALRHDGIRSSLGRYWRLARTETGMRLAILCRSVRAPGADRRASAQHPPSQCAKRPRSQSARTFCSRRSGTNGNRCGTDCSRRNWLDGRAGRGGRGSGRVARLRPRCVRTTNRES